MLKILLVEDNVTEALLVSQMLSEAVDLKLIEAGRLVDGISTVRKEQPDLVLLDLSLPDSHGYETFAHMKCAALETPIVILTGTDDQTVATSAVSQGAADYLPKQELQSSLLVRTVRHALERKRAEELLRRSERFSRSTLDALGIEVAILDERSVIVFTNKAWNDFALANNVRGNFGIGANYLEICDAAGEDSSEAAAVAAGIRAVIRGEAAEFKCEYPCHSPDEERWFVMRATRFPDSGPTQVVVAHDNITAQKKLRDLEIERLSLKNAITGMEQVLGIVGHELRTPLAGMLAMVEYMTSPEIRGTPDGVKFLPMVLSEVSRMSDTVDNLLEAARLDSGQARWNWGRFTLAGIFDEVIDNCRMLVDPQQVALRHTLTPPTLEMLGDEGAVRRLLLNLMNNAQKNTASGLLELTGRSITGGNRRWIELQVRDTGRGIQPAIASRLGEAFALNSGVVGTNCVQGSGLGLAICKGIAAAHGGRLSLQSVVGKGTAVSALLRADLLGPDTSHRQVPILTSCAQTAREGRAA